MEFEQIGQEPQIENGFDPESLLEDKDWQALADKIKKAREDENWTEFFPLAAKVVRAFPEKSGELNIYEEEISTNAWSEAESQLDAYKGVKSWGKFFDLASAMGTVFAERVEMMKDKGILDDSAYKEMEEKIIDAKGEGEWVRFFRVVNEAKTLFPEMISDINIEDDVEEIKKSIDKRRKPGKWVFFCEQAASLKMLGYDILISEDDWQKIKDDFELSKSSDNSDWIAFASSINALNK